MLDPFSFDSDEQKCISQQGPQWTKLTPPQYQIYPYNCEGVIESFECQQKIYATGFLISSCLVLTSAHTFRFFKKNSNKITEVKPASFYSTFIGQLDTLKSCKVIDYRVCPQYVKCLQRISQLRVQQAKLSLTDLSPQQKQKQREKIKQECYKKKLESSHYDYALVKIQKIIERDRYARLISYNPTLKTVVDVAGYYKSKDSFQIYHHSNEIKFESGNGYYAIDTEIGQSGSPVSLQHSQKGEIIGIHKGYDRQKKLNICTLVTEQMISQLLGWAKQFKVEKANFVPYRYTPSSIFVVEDSIEQNLLNRTLEQNQELKTIVQKLMVQNGALKNKIEANLKGQTQLTLLKIAQKPLDLNKNGLINGKPIDPIGHPQNPHNSEFLFSGNLQKFTITKNGQDNNHYIFVKNRQIPKNEVKIFKITQLKSFARHIFTGISTKNGFGITNAPLCCSQSVTFDSKHGQLWQNKRKRANFRKINNNQPYFVVVNTKQGSLKWSIGKQTIVNTEIPASIRSQPLYLVVLLNWEQDIVEIQQLEKIEDSC